MVRALTVKPSGGSLSLVVIITFCVAKFDKRKLMWYSDTGAAEETIKKKNNALSMNN